MRTLEPRPRAISRTRACTVRPCGRGGCGQSREVHAILRPQHARGTQAVQRSPHGDGEVREAGVRDRGHTRSMPPFRPELLLSQAPVSLQPKPAVSAPGDRYEQEADRVAEQVLSMSAPHMQRRPGGCGGGSSPIQCRQTGQDDAHLNTKPSETNPALPTEVPPSVRRILRSDGQPLDGASKAFFEPRFGHDFSSVRVHTGQEAATAAADVSSQAFTLGRHIVFGDGEFAPDRAAGRRLLSHELAHVIQQGAAGRVGQTPVEPVSTQSSEVARVIQRRTFGIAGACWFSGCDAQLQNFFMIPEDGPPGFHPSGSGSFRVDDIDGFWFKFHTPKTEWFKIPDFGTGWVTCTDDEENPSIRSANIGPFVTAHWSSDPIHTPNPY